MIEEKNVFDKYMEILKKVSNIAKKEFIGNL